MNAIEFNEQNIVYAKDQPEYQPLPALQLNNPTGEVITCWQLSFIERLKLLVTGKLWLSVLTFKKPIQPLFMSVHKDELIVIE